MITSSNYLLDWLRLKRCKGCAFRILFIMGPFFVLQMLTVVFSLGHACAADWKVLVENKEDGITIRVDMDSVTTTKKGVFKIWQELLPEPNTWQNQDGAFLVRVLSLKEINCAERSVTVWEQRTEDSKSTVSTVTEMQESFTIQPNMPDEILYKLLCDRTKTTGEAPHTNATPEAGSKRTEEPQTMPRK